MSGIIGGAIGGITAGFGSMLAMLIFAPLTATNNLLGSYYFGSGMILGERQMYQEDWPKIKKDLDSGKPFIEVLEKYMRENTQAVMVTADSTLQAIKPEWERIVKNYMATIPQNIIQALRTDITFEDLINLWNGGTTTPAPTPTPDDPTAEPLRSESFSYINSLGDLDLQAFHNNLSDFDALTQSYIIAEVKRRADDVSEPSPTPDPGDPQFDTQLDPEFVGTLTAQDLDIGGARFRLYKNTDQHWYGQYKMIHNPAENTLKIKVYKSNAFVLEGTVTVTSAAAADAIVNQYKTNNGSSYVLVFSTAIAHTYYLIRDNYPTA